MQEAIQGVPLVASLLEISIPSLSPTDNYKRVWIKEVQAMRKGYYCNSALAWLTIDSC